MSAKCDRCAVLEDLLETARIQVEHARREAEKADDEVLELKANMMNIRQEAYTNDYGIICEYRARAEAAEAKLAASQPSQDQP